MSAKKIMDSSFLIIRLTPLLFWLNVLCLLLLVWPLAGVHTERMAWLGRVLTVGHACCTEIRNQIEYTEKQNRKVLTSPAVGNPVALVAQWMFI